jgi:phosphoglycolate phosphatase
MIKLAVLGMAGTTVRDDDLVVKSVVNALAEMGLGVESPGVQNSLDYVRDTMGQPRLEVFRALFGGDEARAREANRRFEETFDAAVSRGEVEPLAGSETTFAALGAMGVRVCLTTGFSRTTREQLLDVLGWRDLVDLALSPEDGRRGRPYPDLILAAVTRLEIDAVQEVAIAGDTTSELEAGTRAGASIVAGVLTGSHRREQLATAPHTHILRGIDELPAVIASTI